MARDSFLLYKSFWEPIKGLSDEQLGRLFRALYEYQINGTPCTDKDVAMAFGFFKNMFDVDDAKYSRKVDNIRNNASGVNREKSTKTETQPTEEGQPSTEDYLKVLFFRNIPKAEEETKRFMGFYESTGWKLQSGEELMGSARISRAEVWKPVTAEPRFSREFMDVWWDVYKALPAELHKAALKDRMRVREQDNEVRVFCHPLVWKWLHNEGREAGAAAFAPYFKKQKKVSINQF